MGTGGRYRQQHSYGHHCERIRGDAYSISWTVDRYYQGSRFRHPTTYTRITDGAGARRFCKRWGLPEPALDTAGESGGYVIAEARGAWGIDRGRNV